MPLKDGVAYDCFICRVVLRVNYNDRLLGWAHDFIQFFITLNCIYNIIWYVLLVLMILQLHIDWYVLLVLSGQTNSIFSRRECWREKFMHLFWVYWLLVSRNPICFLCRLLPFLCCFLYSLPSETSGVLMIIIWFYHATYIITSCY